MDSLEVDLLGSPVVGSREVVLLGSQVEGHLDSLEDIPELLVEAFLEDSLEVDLPDNLEAAYHPSSTC